MDKIEALKKYKELLDLGIITQEEFDEKKAAILNTKTDAPAEMAAPQVTEAAGTVEIPAADETPVAPEVMVTPVAEETVETAGTVEIPAPADLAETAEVPATPEIMAAPAAEGTVDAPGTVEFPSETGEPDVPGTAAPSDTASALPEGAAAVGDKAKAGIDDFKKKASGLSKNVKIAIAALLVIALVGGFVLFGGSVSQDKLTGIWVGTWFYEGDQIKVGISFDNNGTYTELVYHNDEATGLEYGDYEIKGRKVECHDSLSKATTTYKYRNGKLTNNGHQLTKSN